MAFVDELQLTAKAGNGGNGVVRWRQEKFIAKGGPAGGDGGRGGDVYFRAVTNLSKLADYSQKPDFRAGNGIPGGSKSLHGANGDDLYIDVPVGSYITNLDTNEVYEFEYDGKTLLALRGGKGGLGNERFKSSTNTTPYESTPGAVGESGRFFVEIRLFADAGLIGLPSAGKSSLLNALTNAKSKVGAYHFTTLEPHLGALYGMVLADIPGLIEGASEGKGLGYKFLRHIKRTKFLVHLVSFELGADMMKEYKAIRNELFSYDESLAEKDEIILLTKTDLVDGKIVKEKVKEFKKLKKPVFIISLYDDESVKEFKDELVKILKK